MKVNVNIVEMNSTMSRIRTIPAMPVTLRSGQLITSTSVLSVAKSASLQSTTNRPAFLRRPRSQRGGRN